MKIKTNINGCFIFMFKKNIDLRGYFQRIYQYKKIKIKQISVSSNKKKNTFRGMHYQKGKFSENKFLKCISGEINDIVIDIRKNSKTYLNKFSVKLKQDDNKVVFIPKGCLHGFMTLKENSKILYLIDQNYSKTFSSGYNYRSEKFKIKLNPNIISDKDKNLPFFE